MPPEPFPARLKQLREAKRLTQQQLADAAKIQQSKISEYEAGTRQPRLDSLRKLAAALDVPLSKLID